MRRISLYLLLLTFSGSLNCLYGQSLVGQVVSTGGQSITIEQISLSYTIGELSINTLKGNDITLYQGFQFSRESIITEIDDSNNTNWKAFPAPFSTSITIQMASSNDLLKYEVIDLQGRSIMQSSIYSGNDQRKVKLNLSNLEDGYYHLRLFGTNDVQHTLIYKSR